MHKDQKRVQGALLPFIMDRVFEDTPEAVRDCTVLNRALIQGPDPLFLMETCPAQFESLCRHLGLTTECGRDAIEQAHWRGPGVLLAGTGLPTDWRDPETGSKLLGMSDFKEPWLREALWLVLASVSDTTEEGYQKDTSILVRMQRAMRAGTNLEANLKTYHMALLSGAAGSRPEFRSALTDAFLAAEKFIATTVFTPDANGIPVTDVDAGFYVGYKRGFKVMGVRAGDKVFYGTTPDTTLDAQGVKVDEKVSESYGFVRDPK